MRVVASHAGPVKEIEKKFDKLEYNSQRTKPICETEAEILMPASSIQSNSQNTQLPGKAGSCDDEELESIEAAIANAPFMQDSDEQKTSSPAEPPTEDKFSAAVARTSLERLRQLDIPLITEVRSLVAQTSEAQLESNISALEEEAATKGLKSPIAAFNYFVSDNCQPRNDRQAWWNRAAAALGKQQRDSEALPPLADRLIQSVTEYAGEVVVMFTNGQRLSLAQAQGMSWEAIAKRCPQSGITALGEKS